MGVVHHHASRQRQWGNAADEREAQQQQQGEFSLWAERVAEKTQNLQPLRDIEAELIALTGARRERRPLVHVCDVAMWTHVMNQLPGRLRDRGLADHLSVWVNPQNPQEIFLSPSAVAALNEGNRNVAAEVVYALIEGFGSPSNLAFERGAADLLAKEVSDRLELGIFTDHYPAEQKFVLTLIEACRPLDEDPLEWLGLLKRNPRRFFGLIGESTFYQWWHEKTAQQEGGEAYASLIKSLSSPTGQLEGSFMLWAQACAQRYVDYREQQRQNALAGAQKRMAAQGA